MKVYVCGPMSGINDLNRPAFESAAATLREQGHDVVIPHEVVATNDWHEGMKADITAMLKCEKVYTLEGWEKSRGATLEVHIATCLEIPVESVLEAVTTT